MHSVSVIKSPLREPPETLESLCYWFMKEYLENYSIDLTITHMDLSDEGVDGWCMREDEQEFLIQIDENLKGEEYTRTILHECYHVMQHLLGIPQCEICAHLSEQINLDKYSQS